MVKTNGFGRRIFRPAGPVSVIMLAVVLSSCTYIKFRDTVRDPAYTVRPKKILVHVVERNPSGTIPSVSSIFEDQFVEQLEEHGTAALAGHAFLPDPAEIDREAIKRLVDEKGVDTVFIAGPTTRKDLERLRPGELSYASGMYEGGMEDHDRLSAFVNGSVNSTGIYAGKKVFMELVLYDVRSNRRIWSALTRTHIWDTTVDAIKPMAGGIVESLSAEKIIP